MATGGPIQGLSVIAASSDSLYVLYDAETRGRRNVGLLVLDGVSSGQVQVNTFNVGEGTVGRRSLAIVGQTLVGAYKRADGRVAAFTRPVGRGSITELPADAALTATSVPSVAVSGRNVLISWAGSSGASHLWTVSSAGAAVGAVRSITSNIARGEVTGALGGAVFGSATTTSQFSVASGRAARAVGSAPANVTSFSVAASGRNALVVTVANGTARAHFLRSATDRGRTIELGPAVSATHAAVAPTAWGAFSLWPSANTLSIRALRADGRTLGPSFAMGTFRATQPEAFSAAAVGNTVFAFWAEGGNVQMLRINCYS
jgi:hypothetical protein